MELETIAYVSRATRALGQQELDAIVRVSDRNNQRDGITGALVYDGGVFAQVLEGAPEALQRTVQRIARDDRHRDLRIVHEAPIGERAFGRWTMGAYNLADADPDDVDIRELRTRLHEAIAGGGSGRHAHLPAWFRFSLAKLERDEVPEEIVIEPPRFQAGG